MSTVRGYHVTEEGLLVTVGGDVIEAFSAVKDEVWMC
jgi:hypothetical protein